MKVIDKINKLKDTETSIEQMKAWAYMNRVYPGEFYEDLDLENEDAEEKDKMNDIAEKTYTNEPFKWLDNFLNHEWGE